MASPAKWKQSAESVTFQLQFTSNYRLIINQLRMNGDLLWSTLAKRGLEKRCKINQARIQFCNNENRMKILTHLEDMRGLPVQHQTSPAVPFPKSRYLHRVVKMPLSQQRGIHGFLLHFRNRCFFLKYPNTVTTIYDI